MSVSKFRKTTPFNGLDLAPAISRITVLILTWCVLPIWIQAQSEMIMQKDKPLRVEIPAQSANETYRVLSVGKHGVILFYKSLETKGDSAVNWYFSYYDTNLRRQWVKAIPLSTNMDFEAESLTHDTLALLFSFSGKKKGITTGFSILQIVPEKDLFLITGGMMNDQEEVVSFQVQNGRAWIGINIPGGAGFIRTIVPGSARSRTFPLGQGDVIHLRWMKADSSSLFLDAIVSRTVTRKSTEYYLVRYDTSGTIKKEYLIGTQQGERLLTHLTAISPGGNELVLGTYGQGAAKQSQKKIVSDESSGFFSTGFINGNQKNLNFINFLELNHSGSLVGEQDIANLKKKASRKNKPISEFSLDYSIFLHEIKKIDDEYLLLAEVFTPQFRTESFTDFDYYGRPYTNTYSVFEGYRFLNAVVVSFNPEGKLLWDNTIEIRNIVSTELKSRVFLFSSGPELVLGYQSDGKIYSKIIRKDETIESLDFSSLELLQPADKLLSEARGRTEHWYDHFFLSSGYQEIKNISRQQDGKRFVFYFSKIRFDR